MKKPLMFDLYCGLGGATEGFLAEGWHCIGVDIERHQYGDHRYPAQLWIQNINTINGAQLRDADFIWASPPCQKYSYMAMPWTRSKAMAAAIRADESGEALAELNRLFDACFRIQAQASLAAGRHIPMIVENVRGAQPWVGRSRWAFGSFHLWGDVPALMPAAIRADMKVGDAGWRETGPGRQLQDRAIKNNGGSWFNVAHNTTSGKGQNPDGRKQRGSGRAWWDEALDERCREATAIKNGGDWFASGEDCSPQRRASSGSTSRKFASAMIAKIPLPLSRHIAAVFRQGVPT